MSGWFARRSLTLRLALLTGCWVAAGLALTWVFVADVASREMERSFDARLAGQLDALAGAVTLDAGGRPVLSRPVSERRFDRPLSGMYWQIDGPNGQRLTSRSLWDQELPPGAPGHAGITRSDIIGPRGEHLRVIERDIRLPGAEAPLHVQVAAARDATEAEIHRLRGLLAGGFALLGAGLVLVTVLLVSAALAPLRRLRPAVAELRRGTRRALDLTVPPEVQPLVGEIDALVAQNRATVERARAHVGNLAHALRTSLAVLRNALDSGETEAATRQLAAAERLVQHHLGRARTAALAGVAAADLSLLAAAEDVASALERLFADRAIDIEVLGDRALLVRCEQADLTEMLGNLIENACKWARGRVRVRVGAGPGRVFARVEDDGPGLPAAQLEAVRARGARMDEAVPGSGLGLAIVTDLAALYGGGLELAAADADLGGLSACLWLPAA